MDLTKSHKDEALLVKLCRRGDAAAQQRLFGHYADRMMLRCLRYLPDPEDAREAMMDGFLAFFTNIAGFEYKGEGSVQAWLGRIMVNQCLMRLRKTGNLSYGISEAGEDLPDYAEAADARLNAKEIMNMIHGLPEGCRMVFNLFVFEQMSHTEVAALLGVSESTSKSQLHRARALLKARILQTS